MMLKQGVVRLPFLLVVGVPVSQAFEMLDLWSVSEGALRMCNTKVPSLSFGMKE